VESWTLLYLTVGMDGIIMEWIRFHTVWIRMCDEQRYHTAATSLLMMGVAG
jgi:hypothetical protein